MNLIDVASKLATDEQCVAFLEKVRWPNDVRCPICGGDKISRLQRKNPGKNKRLNFYTCLEVTCQQQFTVTSGSRFHAGSYSPDGRWIVFRLEDHGLSGFSRCISMAPTSPQFSLSPASGQASLIGVLGRAMKVTKMMKGSKAGTQKNSLSPNATRASAFGRTDRAELILHALAYCRQA